MKPFFSVIIPVYNVERYLEECIKSVLAQDFIEWEAILIDDGSTDSSGKMCDEWAQTDPRIQVIHQENQGLAGARNTGLRAAAGEWLLFLDSDDFWQNGFLRKLHAHIIENTEFDVHIGRYDMIRAEADTVEQGCPNFMGGPAVEGNLQKRFSTFYRMVDVSVWKMAIRHTWQREKDLWFVPAVRYAEDVVWSLQLFQLDPKICYVDIPFVVYRASRPGSLTATSRPPLKNFESRIAAWKQFISGGKFANGTEDDLFACSFTANKVIGEFQSQVASAPDRDEQYRQAVALMKANMQTAEQVIFGTISFKRYIAARCCLILGPDIFGTLIRRRKSMLNYIKELDIAHDQNR